MEWRNEVSSAHRFLCFFQLESIAFQFYNFSILIFLATITVYEKNGLKYKHSLLATSTSRMTPLVRKDEKNPKIFRESVNGFEGRNEIRDTHIKDGRIRRKATRVVCLDDDGTKRNRLKLQSQWTSSVERFFFLSLFSGLHFKRNSGGQPKTTNHPLLTQLQIKPSCPRS